MLKVENHEFDVKFAQIDMKQRQYKGESVVTVQLMIEFFPSLVDERIVSGALEIKVDSTEIHSIADFEEKSFKGEIGSITLSANNMGDWEHVYESSFAISFGKRKGRKIPVSLSSLKCTFEGEATLVSLYTTSTDPEQLEEEFSLKDFYEIPMKKEVGNSTISKYYVKE